MRRFHVVLLLAIMTGAALGASPPPLVSEGKGARLSQEDVATIAKLCHPHGSPWLLSADVLRFVTPPSIAVEAYLLPRTRTPRLRRGETLHFFQEARTEGRPAYAWQQHGEPRNWAQVSQAAAPFDEGFRIPSGVEKPFFVDGAISDSELVGLVDFVRSSPVRPSRIIREQVGVGTVEGRVPVDGTCPVLSISRLGDGLYKVTTAHRPGAGQEVTIQSKQGRFEVLSVAMWVS